MRLHPKLQAVLWAAVSAPAIPYGGQAAIEGVMMKGLGYAALAMRRMSGSIEVVDRAVTSRFPMLATWPFFRGIVIMIDMFSLGMWALNESAQRYETDMLEDEAAKKGQPVPEAKPQTGSNKLITTLMMILSLAMAAIIFKVAPAWIGGWLSTLFGWGPIKDIPQPTFAQQLVANLLEGLVKLIIFIAYIWSVGLIKEIARVFQYHGAEHIVINAYEDDAANQDLRFIQSHSTAHPRCGTSFIVILILTSVVLFTALDWWLIQLGVPLQKNLPVWYIKWPLRIVGLIPLAGISYEFIKAAFRYYKNPLLRPILRFGMLFQALTTRRPSDEQVEVSLAAFNRARFLTEGIAAPTPAAAQTGA
jgi:uncharacterized protein YqhQ